MYLFQVTYRYYIGMLNFLSENFAKASPILCSLRDIR